METQTYVVNVGAAIQLNEESIRLTRAVQASVPNSSPEKSIENGARVANKFVIFPSDMMPNSSAIFRPLARDITSNVLRNASVLFVPLSRAAD
jgi:hypothetical protein